MTDIKKKDLVEETPHDLYVEEGEVNVEEQLYNNNYCEHFLQEALKHIKTNNEKNN